MKTLRIALLAGILLVNSGCFLQKKPRVAAPVNTPPAAAAPAPAPKPEPLPEQVPLPVVSPPVAVEPAVPPVPQPTTPPPATPSKPSPFPPAAQTPRPVPAPVPAPAQPAIPTPAPALGAILSTNQRRQLDAAYRADLRQANAVLSSLNGRALTPDETDTVNRARAFIQEAGQYHDRDLTTAAELARRARVLTQDLAGALK